MQEEDYAFIAEVNNIGVAHVVNGDINSALHYFRTAFETAKRCRQQMTTAAVLLGTFQIETRETLPMP